MAFVGSFLWKICLTNIGSKAPGNYLDHFWSNRISVVLWEGPKSQNAMIPGFVSPGNPYFWMLIYQITSNSIRNTESFWENMILVYLRNYTFENVGKSRFLKSVFVFISGTSKVFKL